MKRAVPLWVLIGLLLAGLLAMFAYPRNLRPHPKDVFEWTRLAEEKDWSAKAAAGDSEAQFFIGLGHVQPHLQKIVDRIPYLSAVPVIGKRYFETLSYGFDGSVTQEQ